MFMKTTLSTLVCAVLVTAAGSAMANDLDIYQPKDGSSTINQQPTVTFRYKEGSEGYMLDLIGPNANGKNNCDLPQVAFHGYINRTGSQCLQLGEAGGTTGDNGFVGEQVCNWAPPNVLAAGWYAMSVSAYNQNTASFANVADKHDNLRRTQTDCNTKYQDFEVAAQSTTPPEAVAIKIPTGGISCRINTPNTPTDSSFTPAKHTGSDCQPIIKGTNATASVDQTATWFQIWINDANGANLTQKWYKKGSLPNKVECTVSAGAYNCTFPDQDEALETSTATPYTLWVRAWNPAGPSNWSAAVTMDD